MKNCPPRTIISLICFTAAICLTVHGQNPSESLPLMPGQTVEREMTGAETHRYKFDLKKDEFFQVRVEQKGVDVALKLLDAEGKALATMDSPNGKEGPEILSWVAADPGHNVLEVSGFDKKAEKGRYEVRRETARTAFADDRRRVEIERLFDDGMRSRNVTGQADAALDELNRALKGWQQLNDIYLADLTSKNIRLLEGNRELVPIILAFYKELNVASQLSIEGSALSRKSKEDSLEARVKLTKALEMHQALDKRVTDSSLVEKVTRLNDVSMEFSNALKALQYLVKAGEASCLDGIAQTHYNFGEWKEEIEFQKLAHAIYSVLATDRSLNSHVPPHLVSQAKLLEAQKLRRIGDAFDTLGKTAESIEYLVRANEKYDYLYNETKDPENRYRQADTLNKLGILYGREARNNRKAIDTLSRAVEIYRSLPDKKMGEASAVALIGAQHMLAFRYFEARESLKNAVSIFKQLDNKFYQVMTLQALGGLELALNNKARVTEYVNESLAVLQSPDFVDNWIRYNPDTSGFEIYGNLHRDFIERGRLDGIAYSYRLLGDYQKSLEYNEKIYPLALKTRDPSVIRTNLRDIAFVLGKLSRWRESANYYRRALDISRGREERQDLARDFQDLGGALLNSGLFAEALNAQKEALTIYHSVEIDESKAFTPAYSILLSDMSRAYSGAGNKSLAIFFGKRAINAIQGERQRLSTLDPLSQKNFLQKNAEHYRRLADWLIGRGHFAAAEKVLAMLKEEEYFDFVRRDGGEISKLDARVPLSGVEKALIARYSVLADKITKIGQDFTKLDDKKRQLSRIDGSLSAEEQKYYAEMEKELADANAAFQLFLTKELVAEIGKEKAAGIEIDRNLQDKLRKWGEGTVALYTVAGADRYRVVLTTPKVQVDGKTEIKIADLNQKVFAFRAALQNPNVDPRALGKELYDILIKPIEKELKAANAKTLVWSLDGTLRYIPLAALSPDGQKYLIEDYQSVILTSKTRDDVVDSDSNWQALGLGVSEGGSVTSPEDSTRKIPFSPLPGTERELFSIVKDERSQNETGVLTGRRFINKDFTSANLKESLVKETEDGKRKYNVVHIASHFHLGSNDANSFILLGNGQILTLADIRNSPTIDFGNVELITLSACNTGFADDTNGKEIDSLASVIQTKSGKAVLATLWSVADESTALLMSEFYRLRKANPKLTKAEAIQLAQKAMIDGRLKPSGGKTEPGVTKGAESIPATSPGSTAPLFSADKNAPFAHPYYWSPFVLIGNWR